MFHTLAVHIGISFTVSTSVINETIVRTVKYV